MIQSISIRNIALIDRLTICFHSGLQVLSGETGAGKSIVVDAMKLVLGGRADRTLIRSGCEKGSVEAVFDVSGSDTAARLLERESLDFDGSSVTIYREISAGGKNICRINGVPARSAPFFSISTVRASISSLRIRKPTWPIWTISETMPIWYFFRTSGKPVIVLWPTTVNTPVL